MPARMGKVPSRAGGGGIRSCQALLPVAASRSRCESTRAGSRPNPASCTPGAAPGSKEGSAPWTAEVSVSSVLTRSMWARAAAKSSNPGGVAGQGRQVQKSYAEFGSKPSLVAGSADTIWDLSQLLILASPWSAAGSAQRQGPPGTAAAASVAASTASPLASAAAATAAEPGSGRLVSSMWALAWLAASYLQGFADWRSEAHARVQGSALATCTVARLPHRQPPKMSTASGSDLLTQALTASSRGGPPGAAPPPGWRPAGPGRPA